MGCQASRLVVARRLGGRGLCQRVYRRHFPPKVNIGGCFFRNKTGRRLWHDPHIMDMMESPKAKTQRPRSRKSIAHMPSPDTINKENTTVDSATLVEASKASHKKSRSKSIGPGGLDALKETTGNRRDVGHRAHGTKEDSDFLLSGNCSTFCEINLEAHNNTLASKADPTSSKCASTTAITAQATAISNQVSAQANARKPTRRHTGRNADRYI